MNSFVRNACMVVLTVAISFSIVVCVNASINDMTTMDVGQTHSAQTLPGHIDHAVSLSLAVIPVLILLALIVVAFLLYCIAPLTTPKVSQLYESITFSSSEQKLLLYHFFSPRSPPVY